MTERSLVTMPNEVLNNIVKDFEIKKIFQLRLVCKKLQSHVDTAKPDFKLKYIRIISITNGFLLHFGFDENELEQKNYRKTSLISFFDDEKWNVLEILLGHQKSMLGTFDLVCRGEEHQMEEYAQVLKNLKKPLSTENRKLNVRFVRMDAIDQDQVMQILPHLNPKYLKSIVLKNPLRSAWNDLGAKDSVLEINQIKELDQWKQATFFSMIRFQTLESFDVFDHFERVAIGIKRVFLSDLVALREKLLHSAPHKRVFSIHYNQFVQNRGPEVLGPVTTNESMRQKTYTYRIPNEETTVLCLTISEKYIVFRRLPEQEIVGRRIRNIGVDDDIWVDDEFGEIVD